MSLNKCQFNGGLKWSIPKTTGFQIEFSTLNKSLNYGQHTTAPHISQLSQQTVSRQYLLSMMLP